MILVDFNQTLISNLMANIGSNPNADINEDLIRHMVLSSILMYKRKFGQDYGNLVFACDDRNYWRKDVFPFYKSNRKKTRDKSDFDWKLIFNTLNKIRDEIKKHFNYVVIQVDRAEADDVIGSLVFRSQKKDFVSEGLFEEPEQIMIVSGDKDFVQLQKFSNVKQYSPIQKRLITTDDPDKFIKEHIMRGDSGDGVPNFLSDDDVFIQDGKRQSPIYKKKLEVWLNESPEEFCDSEMLRNYHRNKQLIDLDCIPRDIQDKIVEEYEKGPHPEDPNLFNYFIKKQLKHLMESISEF